MRHTTIKLLLAIVLVTSTVPLLTAKPANSAGIAVFDAIADAVRSLMHGMQAIDHAANVADRSAAVATKAVLTASNASCETLYTSYQAANIVGSSTESVTSTALSVIGGGSADLVTASAKLVAINSAIVSVGACIKAAQVAITGTPIATQVATASLVRWTPIQAALEQSRDQLLRDQKASAKDILKAFMVKTILTVSKNLTTEMVNKMVEKYKISDYLAYGDAVANQVYSMKYINENYSGDARQQMMIRSMLQSEKFPEKFKTVQSIANSKAQEYLGSACGVGTGVGSDDQNYFLKCLAAYGSNLNNPDFHVLEAASQVQTTKAAANNSAQSELSQSDGFAPPRSCGGSLAFQQQIDGQYDKAYQEKDIAVATTKRLKLALAQNPPKTTQAEVDTAQSVENQAIANVEALRKQVTLDSKGKTTNSPIVDVCEAIDSPAKFVSSSINSYLAKHFEESSQLKSENLPFYASFLSDVASNFLTNILTGGKSTSQVFKEAGIGALNGALIGVAQTQGGTTGTTPVDPNPVGSVTIYAQPTGGGSRTTTLVAGQKYSIIIDFSDIADEGLRRVVIGGLGVQGGTNNLTLSAQELASKKVQFDDYIPTPGPFALRATFYGPQPSGESGEKQLGPYSQNFNVSQVNGASIMLLRGPEVAAR